MISVRLRKTTFPLFSVDSIFKLLSDGGTALAFKPDNISEYLVGTEEGSVHLCSTEYGNRHLRSYTAHHSPVATIQWNTFLPDTFITSAAEFLIKIWSITYS